MLQKLWKISFLMQYEFITEAYLENIQTSEMDTVQKIKFSIEDFFSKCDQIRSFLKTSFFEHWNQVFRDLTSTNQVQLTNLEIKIQLVRYD